MYSMYPNGECLQPENPERIIIRWTKSLFLVLSLLLRLWCWSFGGRTPSSSSCFLYSFFFSTPFHSNFLHFFFFSWLFVHSRREKKERKRRITRTYMYTYIQPHGERSSTLNDIQGRLPSQPNRYEAGVKYIRGEIYPAEPRSPG